MDSKVTDSGLTEQLTKLSKLHADGVLTDGEFTALKEKLVAKSVDAQAERDPSARAPMAGATLFSNFYTHKDGVHTAGGVLLILAAIAGAFYLFWPTSEPTASTTVHADPLSDCVSALPTLMKLIVPPIDRDLSRATPDERAHPDVKHQLDDELEAVNKLSNATVDGWDPEIKKLTCSADFDKDIDALLKAIHDYPLMTPNDKANVTGSITAMMVGAGQMPGGMYHRRVRYTVQPTSTGGLVTLLQ
jgi:hypothetical protein